MEKKLANPSTVNLEIKRSVLYYEIFETRQNSLCLKIPGTWTEPHKVASHEVKCVINYDFRLMALLLIASVAVISPGNRFD